MEREKQIEEAFLNEEQKAIQKEQADQMVTKRIIDKMMFAKPEDVGNVICELLANYKGIFWHVLISKKVTQKITMQYIFLKQFPSLIIFYSKIQATSAIRSAIQGNTMTPSNHWPKELTHLRVQLLSS